MRPLQDRRIILMPDRYRRGISKQGQDQRDVTNPDSSSGDAQLYARSFVDVYDDWYGDLDDPAAIVQAFQKRIPAPATILELGSGTGRLAAPLADAGYSVVAIDSSAAMLHQSLPGPDSVAADMQTIPLQESAIDGVLIAYNTLFNLAAPGAQQSCLAEISRVLVDGGLLALDLFSSPIDDNEGFGLSIKAHPALPEHRLAIVTGPHPTEPGVIVGSHIELTDTTTCRPWVIAYAAPPVIDEMAEAAALRLIDRHEDWADAPFDVQASLRHVSWYQYHRPELG